MLRQLGAVATRIFEKTCPDPFVIAVALAVVAALLALTLGDFSRASQGSPALVLVDAWRSDATGAWRFLAFGMQMCLVLVTGHALAATRPVRRLIAGLAVLPRSQGQAAALVGAVACLTGVINWGLSLIVGALLAREVGRSCAARKITVHYPLLAAAGFFGLMVWHGGLSGSAPLSVTTRDGAAKVLSAEYVARLGPGGIPLTQTLFTPLNAFVTGGLLVLTPLLLMLIGPRHEADRRGFEQYAPAADEPAGASTTPTVAQRSIPEWLDRSWLVVVLAAIPFFAAVLRFLWIAGGGADSLAGRIVGGFSRFGLNEVNAAMLALGLVLHGSARAYMAAAEDAARGCAGIIVQFPIYGGVIALVESSGLVTRFAAAYASFGDPQLIILFTFFSAMAVNFFIPSGGAQWGVQGPIAMQAATDAQMTDLGRVVMAVAYGDQATNMLQPFWALPLLSITGVRAGEIVGYTSVIMLCAIAWSIAGLMLF